MAKLKITEEMLDAIEAVKGVRDPNYWDPNFKRYLENQNKGLEKKTKDELEEKGRELGIELDKRQSKEKLIQQIENSQKKG